MGKIIFISAPCGSGKTSFAMNLMNEDKEGRYIYCTPFLDEIDRVRNTCGRERFKEPEYYSALEENEEVIHTAKIDSFNNLLSSGESIAVTHATFLNATQTTLDALEGAGYVGIFDEALDVVVDFNKTRGVKTDPRQSMSNDDIREAIEKQNIKICEHGLVKWIGNEEYTDFKLSELRRMAKLNRLYLVNGTLLVTVFPSQIFSLFKTVYVLTYIPESTTIYPYFKLWNYEIELYTIAKAEIDEKTEYSLIPCFDGYDAEYRKMLLNKVHICSSDRLNRPEYKRLSRRTYDRAKKGSGNFTLEKLKTDIGSYYNTYLKSELGYAVPSSAKMWTCYSAYENKLQGKGYTKNTAIKSSPKLPPEILTKMQSCFVPCNIKATNIYKDRYALAYCVDLSLNPYIVDFFHAFDNDENSVSVNDDAFALGCFIQWMCRSRIREDKDIYVYIPSKRIRELVIDWMNNGDAVFRRKEELLL